MLKPALANGRVSQLMAHLKPESAAGTKVGTKTRVGIVGYGKIGQFLVKSILEDPKCSELMELAFVCDPGDLFF